MPENTSTGCPPWCIGGHGPRFAHTSPPDHVFDVITQLRMHRGEATLSISFDTERKRGGISLDLDGLDAVIGMLTNRRNHLAHAVGSARLMVVQEGKEPTQSIAFRNPVPLDLPPIVRAVQTCAARPAQWDAWDATGQYHYLRYRYGYGEVERCDGSDAVGAGAIVAKFEHGTKMSGEISLDLFCYLAGLTLDLADATN